MKIFLLLIKTNTHEKNFIKSLVAIKLLFTVASCSKKDALYTNNLKFDGKSYTIPSEETYFSVEGAQTIFWLHGLDPDSKRAIITLQWNNDNFGSEISLPVVSNPRWYFMFFSASSKTYNGSGASTATLRDIKSGKVYVKKIDAANNKYQIRFSITFTDNKTVTGSYSGTFINSPS